MSTLARPIPLNGDFARSRLARLAELDEQAERALQQATLGATSVAPRAELFVEGRPIGAPRILLDGWAARVRVLADGRRQFLSFFLPGDLIGMCRHERPVAVSTVVALSPGRICPAPPAGLAPSLAGAYAVSGALEEAYLLAQITRLGRLNAQERICDLFLEFLERLGLCGNAQHGGFDCPLTQETLGDALGLTPVHINRTLQQLRAAGDVEWRGKRVTVRSPQDLARRLGRSSVAVQSPAVERARPEVRS